MYRNSGKSTAMRCLDVGVRFSDGGIINEGSIVPILSAIAAFDSSIVFLLSSITFIASFLLSTKNCKERSVSISFRGGFTQFFLSVSLITY